MLIAATDSDLLDRANRIRSCFDSVAFFDEWQEEQFDEEQLESMSLVARQDELKEILADPSVAVMHDSLSCSLIALNGMREMFSNGPDDDDSFKSYANDVLYSRALAMAMDDYLELKEQVLIHAGDGNLEAQDAVAAPLLMKLPNLLEELETACDGLDGIAATLVRLAPEHNEN